MNALAHSRRPRRQQTPSTARRRLLAQQLESRHLLAGDVDVLQFFGNVIAIGDSASNALEIRTDENGDAAIFGLDGTTVNGSSDPYLIGDGDTVDQSLRLYLGRGDDSVLIDGINVEGNVTVYGQRGDDAVGLLRTNVSGDVNVRDSSGALNFSLDLSTIGDDLRVTSGSQDDTIVVDGSTIVDDTFFATGSGDDTIVVLGSSHQDDVRVLTGRGDDFVAVVDTTIGDDVSVFTSSGNDDLLIRDSVLSDRVNAFGGWGSDRLELAGEVSLNPDRTPRIRSFQTTAIEGANDRIDQAIAELVDSGARRPTLLDVATGNEAFTTLVSLVIQADLVGALSTTTPLTVLAPTNTAFTGFIEEFDLTFDDEGNLAVPTELLASVLTYHVVPVAAPKAVVVTLTEIPTLSEDFTIGVENDGGEITLDERAGLVLTDIRTRNGIIHVIDTVITPPIAPFE